MPACLLRYSGWYCRGMISATAYTLVGVVNKFVTILLNIFIWEKHSTALGLLAVCCCLISGVFYEQAPRLDEAHKRESSLSSSSLSKRPADGVVDVDDDEVQAALLADVKEDINEIKV